MTKSLNNYFTTTKKEHQKPTLKNIGGQHILQSEILLAMSGMLATKAGSPN